MANDNNQAEQNTLIHMDQLLPDELFLLPVFSRPIFPGTMAPIMVNNPGLIEGVNENIGNTDFIGIILVKNEEKDGLTNEDLYSTGTVAKILKKVNLPDGGINILVNTLKRFSVKEFINKKYPRFKATVQYKEDILDSEDIEINALTRSILTQLKKVASQDSFLQEQIKLTMANIDDPGKIADFVGSILNLKRDESQLILETQEVKERLQLVYQYINREVQMINVQEKIHAQIDEKIEKQQREFMLREQLKAIKKELGMEDDPKSKEINQFKERLEQLVMEEDVRKRVEQEMEKFSLMDSHSAEYTVTRNYIETILSLPWGIYSDEILDLKRAERILNRDHYGLEDVKERILEFLAVRKLKKDAKGSIICLVGPPGVGKTSLGKSVSNALNREFYRFSLGGMRDEAEIKGHRRTYVGAMPGKILNALKIVKKANPVLMLDEIDKIGISFQGDPASALLEVLDPEQNYNFVDHYLDLPFDLSKVFFITTANTLDTIPRPLLDRMEVIRLSGYIEEEKIEIGRKYLLPRQMERHGLTKQEVKVPKSTLSFVITNYAREAGVRNFERSIEKICRKLAALKARGEKLPEKITKELAREYLGPEYFLEDSLVKVLSPGVAIGMAYTAFGGSTLMIESVFVQGKGNLNITGQLGEVMSESANIAFSYVKSICKEYMVDPEVFNKNNIHLHIPAGATPKDGPSAGITMATAILSLAMNKKMKSRVAMTGELTLNGLVLPIGGLKEKIIAARRNKIKHIIFPNDNLKDLEEIPDYVKKGLDFHPVKNAKEVFDFVFNGKL